MTPEHVTVEREECERELRRVVDRLNSMPLNRAADASTAVVECSAELVRIARQWGVPVPADAVPPAVGPQGFGSMIAVLGGDCLDAADAGTDFEPMHTALVTLRRALP